MEIDDFRARIVPDDERLERIKKGLSDARNGDTRTPFGSKLRTYRWTEESGAWLAPDRPVSDVFAFSVNFHLHANLRVDDVHFGKFSYELSRQIVDNVRNYSWLRVYGLGKKSPRDEARPARMEKGTPRPRPFVFVAPLTEGSIVVDLVTGLAAVGGFVALYPKMRQGLFEIVSDVGKIRRYCANAIERSQTFK